MSKILFAAAYVADNGGLIAGALLLTFLCLTGIAVIVAFAVLYVKSGQNYSAAEEPLRAVPEESNPEASTEETVETAEAPVEETVETAEEPVEETVETAEAPVEETVETAEAPVEETVETAEARAEETVETAEAPVEETVETAEAPAEEAVETAEEPVEETVEAFDITDVNAGGITAYAVTYEEAAATEDEGLPEFIDRILDALSPDSAELFSRYIIDRNYTFYTTMKNVREYIDEKEFLRAFFNNSLRLKKVLNAEIYALLYGKQRRNCEGEELSKLRMKYVNALYYYRKQDPTLVARCINILKDDIDYKFNVANVNHVKVPSLKKLIMIYSARKDYANAIAYCDKAIERDIYDVRQTGFEFRRLRLVEKQEHEKELRRKRAERKRAEKNKEVGNND